MHQQFFGKRRSVNIEDYLRLIAVTARKCVNSRNQNGGESEDMADLVSLLNVLRRKSEQRCGKDFKARIMPLRCVNACGHPSTLPELAGGMSEW